MSSFFQWDLGELPYLRVPRRPPSLQLPLGPQGTCVIRGCVPKKFGHPVGAAVQGLRGDFDAFPSDIAPILYAPLYF